MENKISLPKYFRDINNALVIRYIVQGFGLWLLPGLASYYVLSSDIFWYFKYPAVALLSVVSGMSLFFIASLGHEGFHGALNKNRNLSMIQGIFLSSFVPLFLSTGYTIHHWLHHKHTNKANDPDVALYQHFKDPLTRTLIAPLMVTIKNFFNVFTAMFNMERFREIGYPFSWNKTLFFSLLNVSLVAVFGWLYYELYSYDLLLFMSVVLLPFIVTGSYFGMSPYIEHAGIEEDNYINSRVYTNPVFTFLLMGYNYHLCHHLYPRVQALKLPELYRYLQKESPGFEVKEARTIRDVLELGSKGQLGDYYA